MRPLGVVILLDLWFLVLWRHGMTVSWARFIGRVTPWERLVRSPPSSTGDMKYYKRPFALPRCRPTILSLLPLFVLPWALVAPTQCGSPWGDCSSIKNSLLSVCLLSVMTHSAKYRGLDSYPQGEEATKLDRSTGATEGGELHHEQRLRLAHIH